MCIRDSDIAVGRLHRNMVGKEIDRREKRLSARAVGVDIIDHLLDDEARRIIILGQHPRLAIVGPVRLVIQALDRLLIEIVGARIGQAESAIIACLLYTSRCV